MYVKKEKCGKEMCKQVCTGERRMCILEEQEWWRFSGCSRGIGWKETELACSRSVAGCLCWLIPSHGRPLPLETWVLPYTEITISSYISNTVAGSGEGGCMHRYCSPAVGNQSQQIKGSEKRTKGREEIVQMQCLQSNTEGSRACLLCCTVQRYHNFI